jgi:hypothetical protein
MVKNHNLARSILDSTWYKIRQLAACKAEVIIVDPSNTTQRCSGCGSMPEKKIGLKVRVYECSSCGLVLNRDHNAALEILRKGLATTRDLDKTSKLFRGSMKLMDNQEVGLCQQIKKFVPMQSVSLSIYESPWLIIVRRRGPSCRFKKAHYSVFV